MNTLLIFFALPIATIILAIVLQTILKNPVLVALTFFAIYLIVTFAAFDANFLIFAIAYTILAYISAVITRFVMNCNDNDENNNSNVDVVTQNNNIQNLATAINTANLLNSSNCGCGCRSRRR